MRPGQVGQTGVAKWKKTMNKITNWVMQGKKTKVRVDKCHQVTRGTNVEWVVRRTKNTSTKTNCSRPIFNVEIVFILWIRCNQRDIFIAYS